MKAESISSSPPIGQSKPTRLIKAVDLFITQYRDDDVVHNHKGHKQTIWFMNYMNEDVRFIGGSRPSITPKELIFVLSNYISSTAIFINMNILNVL